MSDRATVAELEDFIKAGGGTLEGWQMRRAETTFYAYVKKYVKIHKTCNLRGSRFKLPSLALPCQLNTNQMTHLNQKIWMTS